MFGTKKKQEITEKSVMTSLGTVIEPELHRDLVTLNMIKDLQIDGNDVTFTIVLTTPACPLKSVMQKASEEALQRDLPEIGRITINWTANVPKNTKITDAHKNFRNIIAVASGKGGVGKSTLAVNIAVSLAQSGATVGLLDADILGPNVPIMLGKDRMPPPRNHKMVPAENYGVKFISTAFLMKADQALVWRGPMLNTAIRQFLNDVDWGELDYLIVDLPPGTGDASLSLAQAVPLTGAVVVTQPMGVAVADALRCIKMFETLEVPILGVVENMSGDFFGTGAGEELAKQYNVPFLGKVPLESGVRIGGDAGRPIIFTDPENPASRALSTIASQVAARISVLSIQTQTNFIPLSLIQ